MFCSWQDPVKVQQHLPFETHLAKKVAWLKAILCACSMDLESLKSEAGKAGCVEESGPVKGWAELQHFPSLFDEARERISSASDQDVIRVAVTGVKSQVKLGKALSVM